LNTPLRCVIYATIGIKQFINDALTPKVNRLLDHIDEPSTEFFVPNLFYVECANVLCKYVRANLYTAQQVEADLADLKALNLLAVPTQNLMVEATGIALHYSISAYDGCYVFLSSQANAPLLTLDERLVNSLAGSHFDVRLFTDFEVPIYSDFI
jgi:predicted nucleic acid-binding protein